MTTERALLTDHPFTAYRSPHRLYGLCWSTRQNDLRLATSTFIPGEYANKLQILHPSADGTEILCALEIDHPYPPTKIMWAPESLGSSVEYFASTADYLRIWSVTDTSIKRDTTIYNKMHQETCAPLTSFDWNEAEPSIIGTSSIDTTCTIWDLNNLSAPKNQIIAHDEEVYDMAFSCQPNVFGSVSGDGSLRLFDLRDLKSCNIAYEAVDHQPLLRLAWNRLDDRFIAAIISESSKIVLLDVRNTSRVLLELDQHTASVNSISWSPHSRFHICSSAQDRTAIVYDISSCAESNNQITGDSNQNTNQRWNSSIFFQSKHPIYQIRWSNTRPNCIALADEDAVHVVQV